MDELLQYVITGITVGMVYALIALGSFNLEVQRRRQPGAGSAGAYIFLVHLRRNLACCSGEGIFWFPHPSCRRLVVLCLESPR